LRVDLRLRPDPGSTAVAISLPAAFSYYENLGQNWERAALIKARPVAGDKPLGSQFLADLAPFIWRKYFDYGSIADIHAMKRQIHAVRGHAEVAARHGAVIEADHDIRGWRVEGGAVIVETSRETLSADRLVLCPGPWAADLLQLPAIPFTVLRKSLFWYPPSAGLSTADAAALPTFAFDTPRGFFYGFPALDARGLKLAEHTGGRVVTDPLHVDRAIDAAEQATIEGWLADHLPGVSHTRTAHEVCLYTMSPDHHFVVGLHPAHPQVAVAAGFSGHGFKFASVIGEVLADLALTGTTPHPIGFLAPLRFSA
jgi:glycine/D-amino acid oxidase-like deaminating enzyme